MKKKHLLCVLLIGLLTAGLLFAGGEQEKEDAAPGEAKGELTNWTWTYVCIDEWLVPAFNKEYPNIKINTVPMSFPETHDKIFAAIAAGSGAPDFATIVSDYVQKFIDQAVSFCGVICSVAQEGIVPNIPCVLQRIGGIVDKLLQPFRSLCNDVVAGVFSRWNCCDANVKFLGEE